MKRIKKFVFNKITFAITLMLTLIGITFISTKTYAYTIDPNENLVGDNLCNIESSGATNGYTFTLKQGGILKFSGTFTSGYNSILIANNLVGNTDYTISCEQLKNVSQGFWAYDINNNFLGTTVLNNGEATFNYSTTYSLHFIIDNNYYDTINTLYLMLNIGNTAKDWEPYGIWYSEQNYNNLQSELDVVNDDFDTLKNTINYGIYAYFTGYVWDSSISTTGNVRITGINPNNSSDIIYIRDPESHSVFWSFEALRYQNILQTGAIFDTTIVQDLEDYDGNYVYYFDFVFNHLPLNALYLYFKGINNIQVVIRDYDNNTASFNINNDVKVITSQDILDLVPNFNGEIYSISTTGLSNIQWRGQIIGNTNALTSYNTGYADARQQFNYLSTENDILNNEINRLNTRYEDLLGQYNQLQVSFTDLQVSYQNALNGNNFTQLFFTIAETPFNTFKTIWNVDFLGVNLAGFVTGILFVGLLIWVVKKIF